MDLYDLDAIDRRMFLRRSAGVAGALAVGGLAACGDDQQQGQQGRQERVTLRLPGEDQGFPSPFAYMRGGGYVQMSFIYDTLLWKDASGELLPWMAARYERSNDGRRYTFQLRDGLTWHDGRPVTAEDVAFSFRYFAEKEGDLSPEVIVQPVPQIADVRARDRLTVEFGLDSPVATFLQFGGAGAVPIVPRHVWSQIQNPARETNPEVLIGSGPYRLESYSAGEGSYLYTAVDDYFLGRPVVRRIENLPVGDELQALQAGTIDQASDSGLRPPVLEPFRNNPAVGVFEAPPGVSGLGLYWNLDQGGALADVRFRRACARAINREGIVQRAFGGNGTVGSPGWVPPGHPYHVDVEEYPFDIQAARRLMEEGGYDTPLRYSLLVTNDPVPPVAEVIARQLSSIGVELEIEPVDTPTFNERVIGGDVEMSIIGSGGMNSDLAPDYLRLIYNSDTELTQHAQGYRNPEVNRLTEEQLRTLDRSERMEICARIQRLVAQDLPLLPLIYPTSFNLVRKEAFDAWYYTPGGVAGVVPTLQNKHAFVTGRKTGIQA